MENNMEAEVEGLTGGVAYFRVHMDEDLVEDCVRRDDHIAALTALQAENERLLAENRRLNTAVESEGKIVIDMAGAEGALTPQMIEAMLPLLSDPLFQASEARAEKAEAELDAWKANAEVLAVALRVTRDDLSSVLHSEFDGVWSDADFEEETASADDALAAHAKLKGEV